MNDFQVEQALLKRKDMFPRFRIGWMRSLTSLLDQGVVKPEHEVLVVERGNQQLAFLVREIAGHLVAQGELAGKPYMITF